MKRILISLLCVLTLSACSHSTSPNLKLTASYKRDLPLNINLVNIEKPHLLFYGANLRVKSCTGVGCFAGENSVAIARREAKKESTDFVKHLGHENASLMKRDYSSFIKKQPWLYLTKQKRVNEVEGKNENYFYFFPLSEHSDLSYTGKDYFSTSHPNELQGKLAYFYRFSEDASQLIHTVSFQIFDPSGKAVYKTLVGDIYTLPNAKQLPVRNKELWLANGGANFKKALNFLHRSVDSKFTKALASAAH